MIFVAWAAGALYFDFPMAALRLPLSIAFLVVILALVIFLRDALRKLTAAIIACGLVTLWWFTLRPSNDRDWQPDVAETAWAEQNGDMITLHNVRNCDYRTETDYTPRWETRTVDLSHLTGIDLAITYWGSPWIAHPIVSFQFSDALPICFSIEARKTTSQTYSLLGSIYRRFTLIYIAADERDLIRLRSNYRPGEDVYLYHVLTSPARAQGRFLEYIKSLNALKNHPRWYNALTTNCTTSIRTQHEASERMPWDWRILVNGKGDEMLYERHLIATSGLSFAELKQRSLINKRAQAANDDPQFSQRIREGLP